ncbi:SDR family oxidoreductase [Candidatus Hecatella orcuttiae]|jgi:UDP-glucuronate decarboxylase|uniref:UDP-glucuronic acid decarboxylase family protein n=1 Tax=Candidatus Hecatella orcuttiae TaxID=1935119 RepID=UPI0028680032|nr:SDR family oxidoreductase [Candidatus Hecatella orcuttiae]
MAKSTIGKEINQVLSQLKENMFAGKRILVTGGAGFLGSWLCDILTGTDAEVFCLDNLATGLRENIDHLRGNKNFHFIEGNAENFSQPQRLDIILHLASRTSPEEYQKHPIETLKANSLGTLTVLEAARLNDALTLYASTSEVYGDAQVIPTPETYWGHVNPVGVRSCYDEGKRFGEALCAAYRRQYSLDVRVVRIFNTYGPRIRADGAYARAVPRFITQALLQRDITVYGDGSQTRSFCYVTDTVAGMLKALTSPHAKGEIFNIGNPHEITILQLAEKIKQIAGSTSQVTFHPLPEDDPKRRCPDISKAKTVLGWEPVTSLEEGLAKTVDWFRSRIF